MANGKITTDVDRGMQFSTYIIEILEEYSGTGMLTKSLQETRLGDLGLESISLVYLIGEVQHYYNLQDLLVPETESGCNQH